MKELKRRLRFAWKNMTHDTLRIFAHSMPGRLENVIKNKGGFLVTNNLNNRMKNKPKKTIYLIDRRNKLERTFEIPSS